ncbi:hypothetical protein SCLCIDRAFT_1224341 [Scleroderma citrinum Foug A]|uniref:Secreted peptide n=1 Tax=Scleroderma citrinum Foug A TaxID=1036808 RepID=A0A0C3D6B4_9AGAM|nr:hypothetical protein SCLCIDRAFT_1224341 [Scleroderma citrinum Foug A]
MRHHRRASLQQVGVIICVIGVSLWPAGGSRRVESIVGPVGVAVSWHCRASAGCRSDVPQRQWPYMGVVLIVDGGVVVADIIVVVVVGMVS